MKACPDLFGEEKLGITCSDASEAIATVHFYDEI